MKVSIDASFVLVGETSGVDIYIVLKASDDGQIPVCTTTNSYSSEEFVTCKCLVEMLFSQVFVFLPKFIKAQLQLVDLLFQSFDSFPVSDFGFDFVTFRCRQNS